MAAHRRGRSPGRRGTIGRYAAAAVAALMLLVGAAAPAAAAPSAEVPTTMVPGGRYRVSGSGWPVGNQCSVMLHGAGSEIPWTFDECTIEPGGILDDGFTVPVDLPPGSYDLWVDSCPGGPALSPSCSWSQAVDIVEPDGPPSDDPPSDDPPSDDPPSDDPPSDDPPSDDPPSDDPPASTPGPDPTIALSPDAGPPGTTIHVTGTGFVYSTCTVTVLAASGTCSAEPDGAVTGTVRVPPSTPFGFVTVAVCTGCEMVGVSLPPRSATAATFKVTEVILASGHDLAVTSAAVDWTDRGAIVVDAIVENLGAEDSPAASVEVRAEGWATRNRAVATLAAAGRRTVRLTLSPEGGAEPGSHLVTVTVVQGEPDAAPGNDTYEATVEIPEAVLPPADGPNSDPPDGGDEEGTQRDPDGDEAPDDPVEETTDGTGDDPPSTSATDVASDPIADDATEPSVPLAAVVVVLAVGGAAAASTLVHRRRLRRRSLPAGASPGTVPETVASSAGPHPALSPVSGRRVELSIVAGEPSPRPQPPSRPLRAGRAHCLRVAVTTPSGPPGTPLMARVFAAAGVEVRTTTKGGAVEIGAPGDTDPASFPFTVAKGARRFALRCNLYCNGTLVQARLVTGRVRGRLPRRGGIRSVVDYTLVPSLDDRRLGALRPTDLSVLVNRATPGTVQVYAAGGSFAGATSLDAGAVEDAVSMMRRALHTTAWGDDSEWALGKLDRYDPRVADEATRRERLRRDLVAMAKTGYDLYDAVIAHLARGAGAADELTELVRRPSYVEVAHKVSPRLVLPAALLYDHPLDATLPVDDYDLCPSFVAGQDGDGPLDDVGCFQGRCPAHGDLETVCPSGFWGFRHYLGTPVSVADGPDAPDVVEFDGGPTLAVAVSTALELRAAHEEALRALVPPERWRYADDRDAALEVLRRGGAQVAYFYCHGGLSGRGVPYIQVGPGDGRGITRSLLRAKKLRWTDPRPLVVLNGCHTAALTPSKAIDLVSGFVDTANASGVLGTEVTVFEPLAGAFAVELLRRLFAGEELGPAVRGARLALLRTGNPLGLVYVTYASPQLRLAPRPGAEVVAAEVVAGGVV